MKPRYVSLRRMLFPNYIIMHSDDLNMFDHDQSCGCHHNRSYPPPPSMGGPSAPMQNQPASYGPPMPMPHHVNMPSSMNAHQMQYNAPIHHRPPPDYSEPSSLCEECYHRCIHGDFVVTDTDILNLVIKKYNLDKDKLIAHIKRNKEQDCKQLVMDNFYKQHPHSERLSLHEQHQKIEDWNGSCYYISLGDLETYLKLRGHYRF